MRGSFLIEDHPITIDLPNQEKWHQGETIKGIVEGLGMPEGLSINLVFGDKKKLNNLKILQSTELHFKKGSSTFEFSLGQNNPVSEKSQTYFLSLSTREGDLKPHLECTVFPYPALDLLIKSLETFHRFKRKSIKNKKQGLEIKLTPPSSKEYQTLEQLIMLTTIESEILNLAVEFKSKKLSYADGKMAIEKEQHKSNEALPLKDIFWSSDSLNQELALKLWENLLSPIKKTFFVNP
jgi:hypothetical protein